MMHQNMQGQGIHPFQQPQPPNSIPSQQRPMVNGYGHNQPGQQFIGAGPPTSQMNNMSNQFQGLRLGSQQPPSSAFSPYQPGMSKQSPQNSMTRPPIMEPTSMMRPPVGAPSPPMGGPPLNRPPTGSLSPTQPSSGPPSGPPSLNSFPGQTVAQQPPPSNLSQPPLSSRSPPSSLPPTINPSSAQTRPMQPPMNMNSMNQNRAPNQMQRMPSPPSSLTGGPAGMSTPANTSFNQGGPRSRYPGSNAGPTPSQPMLNYSQSPHMGTSNQPQARPPMQPPGNMGMPSQHNFPGAQNQRGAQLSGPPIMNQQPSGPLSGPPTITPGQMGSPYPGSTPYSNQNMSQSRPQQPMGNPMTNPMAGPQQSKRIDPNQMPNPIQVMDDDQANFENEVFNTSSRSRVPPLVSTKCRINDDGNCSPRYMRSTVYSVPCNQDMLKDSGIPLAIVTTPFAKIPQDEHQLRYVDHGPSGPVRCNRCKAYMNPFMQFIDGGRRYVCNICSHSSEVPQEYFCHLDHQGRRVDMYERPELCFGSYEFIATTDYCKESKLPQPPAFIFMIDVSYQSVQQGMVKVLCEELISLLDNLPRDVGMDESLIKVGFVTYNSNLHFYNVKENLAQPQMMVMTDINDAFVPLLDGFLVNYQQSKGVIESLLEMLPEMFRDTRETDIVLGPVITAGIEALKSAGISGKLYIFHSSLPIAEAPGKLKNREDRKLLNTDKEKTILVPQGNYYMNLAKDCVNNGVSMDLFLFPNSYVDVATIGLMVTQTGGQIYRYSYFKEITHGKQFVSDLRKNFKREVGFDAIMRLRCSTGLRPVEFFGSFVMNNTTDIELASIDSDKAIAIEVKHDDKIPEDGVTFVQCALLYTSVAGQRRLRIHNLAFATCSQLADLYRCCELDTTVNYLSKYALRQVLSSNPQAIKENLIQKCVQMLACYRQHCATPSTSGQLILPECMKLLPLYVNCLIKSDVLAGGSEMSSDDRAFLMQACLSMTPAVSAAYFYPRVIELDILDVDHEPDELIPKQIRCLGEKFRDNGVYLLENTISMFIWVGLQAPQDFLNQVFGVNGIGQLDIEMTQLPELDTPLSQRVRQIIEAIQEQRQRYLKLTIVRQRDKLEPWFKHYIVEDKGFNANQLSYVDFLCHVHREIRNLLS